MDPTAEEKLVTIEPLPEVRKAVDEVLPPPKPKAKPKPAKSKASAAKKKARAEAIARAKAATKAAQEKRKMEKAAAAMEEVKGAGSEPLPARPEAAPRPSSSPT